MPKGKKDVDINDIEIANTKNEKIVNEFQKLIDHIKVQIDISPSSSVYSTNLFRLKQITNALIIIKKYPKEIKRGEDLKEFSGIGKGTIERINEILKTGKLSEIKVSKSEGKYSEYVKELEKIHGIGHVKAYELVTKYGIKNIKDLIKAYNDGIIELNNIILTGLKYHNLYKENIPRAEIDKINDYINRIVKGIDKKLEAVICGSYRRQKPTSNDIDILITHSDIKTKLQLAEQGDDNYLLQFVKELKEDKFILDDLTDKDYKIKYMGYCKYVEGKKEYPIRRIDIRYIPYESFYTAMQYFTGSGDFNVKIRRLAEQLGFMLNEYGLYEIKGNKKIKIKITSEKDIFYKLGLEYLPPEKRT